MTAGDVIERRTRAWSVEPAEAVAWLGSLPDDSIDLLFTSPPYEAARSYSCLGFRLRGEAWVEWMTTVFEAAAPKVKGLIAVVCEGQTNDFSYSATPFLLMADLKRAGFTLRRPAVYCRVGIPGSGGPDWLRGDTETVVCVTRPGRLPWSDPTACGRPPRHGVGGAMSNRTRDGDRVVKVQTRRKANGERVRDGSYKAPPLANPGNVIRCKVGGGLMGHAAAHENEAPFSLALCEFFVRSFCPPDGVVCDPFAGSSSTGHAAILHGRRYVGCDLRDSQVFLSQRRLREVEAELAERERQP